MSPPPDRAPDAADGAAVLAGLLRHPEQLAKIPPCQAGCPSGSDVRGWIGIVAQREKLGLTVDEAYRRAWREIVERNPFPATMGRICPHPCESGCNRSGKDGSVAVHALERFLGDWAIEHGERLPCSGEGPWPESLGVIGSGPAGLSFAYQMARRGYAVVVYEREDRPGGMLQRGIPEYRLPKRVLRAEIDRILEVGVQLRLGCAVGRDVDFDELRERHAALFLGVGAQSGRRLGIANEHGEGCWTGVEYLRRLEEGRPPRLGARVAVVGGGNTAIDGARAARRAGCEVTLIYRRTREEMPAIAEEVDDALAEGVVLELLATPVEVLRRDGAVVGLVIQRMRLGEPDASGRRSPVPIFGATDELAIDGMIAAVSQAPDWSGFENSLHLESWIDPGPGGAVDDALWAGGDARGLGIATLAVAQGRHAAESVHARLRGLPAAPERPEIETPAARVRLEAYADRQRVDERKLPAAERLTSPNAEVAATIGAEEFTAEASRCLSCGSCFGCAQCFMYCNPGGITRLEEPAPGAYFALELDACEGCGKCVEVCPCGYLSLR